jgi:hypothetical protein
VLFEISWMHFIILVLASFRLTHLLVYDEITSFLRDPFLSVTFEQDDSGHDVPQIDIKGTGWRYWVGTILSCHWCTGVWSSLAIVALYWLLPITFPLLIVLAISGAAAFIESKL